GADPATPRRRLAEPHLNTDRQRRPLHGQDARPSGRIPSTCLARLRRRPHLPYHDKPNSHPRTLTNIVGQAGEASGSTTGEKAPEWASIRECRPTRLAWGRSLDSRTWRFRLSWSEL